MVGSAAVPDAVEQQKCSRDSGAVRCCDRRFRQCGYPVPGERCMCAGCAPTHLWQCPTAGGPAHRLQPRRRTMLPLPLPSASTSSNCHQLQRCWSFGSRYNLNLFINVMWRNRQIISQQFSFHFINFAADKPGHLCITSFLTELRFTPTMNLSSYEIFDKHRIQIFLLKNLSIRRVKYNSPTTRVQESEPEFEKFRIQLRTIQIL